MKCAVLTLTGICGDAPVFVTENDKNTKKERSFE